MAVLAALGFAGTALAARPDLSPVVDSDPASINDIATNKWFVDTTATPYSLHFHFATTIKNVGAGPFQIVSGGDGATIPGGRSAKAVQKIDGEPDKPLTGVKLLTNDVFSPSSFSWGIGDVASYTLTPSGSATPITSPLNAVCRDDSSALDTPAAPSLFSTPTCTPLDGNATTFNSGISSRWQDTVALSSANLAYFDVTGANPGPATFTATVNPTGEIAESDSTPTSNVVTAPLRIPGVSASAPSLSTQGTTPVNVVLTATAIDGDVLAKQAAEPTTALRAAGPAFTFQLVGQATNGTATINASTGAATYTAKPGFTGTDSFTYYAEDSRGIRSRTTTVTVNVTAVPTTPGTGGTAGTGGTTVTRVTLKLKPSYRVVRKGNKTFLKVTGTLPASQVGRSVKIQRKIGKRIKTVGSAKIGRTGRYTALIRVRTSRVSLRVTIAASATAKGSTTAFKSLVVTKGS